jgi:hypothetical protein
MASNATSNLAEVVAALKGEVKHAEHPGPERDCSKEVDASALLFSDSRQHAQLNPTARLAEAVIALKGEGGHGNTAIPSRKEDNDPVLASKKWDSRVRLAQLLKDTEDQESVVEGYDFQKVIDDLSEVRTPVSDALPRL